MQEEQESRFLVATRVRPTRVWRIPAPVHPSLPITAPSTAPVQQWSSLYCRLGSPTSLPRCVPRWCLRPHASSTRHGPSVYCAHRPAAGPRPGAPRSQRLLEPAPRELAAERRAALAAAGQQQRASQQGQQGLLQLQQCRPGHRHVPLAGRRQQRQAGVQGRCGCARGEVGVRRAAAGSRQQQQQQAQAAAPCTAMLPMLTMHTPACHPQHQVQRRWAGQLGGHVPSCRWLGRGPCSSSRTGQPAMRGSPSPRPSPLAPLQAWSSGASLRSAGAGMTAPPASATTPWPGAWVEASARASTPVRG